MDSSLARGYARQFCRKVWVNTNWKIDNAMAPAFYSTIAKQIVTKSSLSERHVSAFMTKMKAAYTNNNTVTCDFKNAKGHFFVAGIYSFNIGEIFKLNDSTIDDKSGSFNDYQFFTITGQMGKKKSKIVFESPMVQIAHHAIERYIERVSVPTIEQNVLQEILAFSYDAANMANNGKMDVEKSIYIPCKDGLFIAKIHPHIGGTTSERSSFIIDNKGSRWENELLHIFGVNIITFISHKEMRTEQKEIWTNSYAKKDEVITKLKAYAL